MYNTVCPGSRDPLYIVSYYIKWVRASWTHCIIEKSFDTNTNTNKHGYLIIYEHGHNYIN